MLGRHSTVRAAADELGSTPMAVTNMFRRVGEAASQHLGRVNVPEGHRVKGNSTLEDAAGNVDRRWVKTERDSDDPPAFEPVPPGHLVSKVSTLLDGQGKARAQWIQAPQEKARVWEQFWAACDRATERYRGIAASCDPPETTQKRLLTLYPLGDPHIGMLAWGREVGADFDVKIAERDLYQCVDMLVERAPASELAVLANVGDFFHAETDAQLTPTAGHKLDCDTRWAKTTDIGFTLMRRLVDRLRAKHARVRVVNVPGNHDPYMARMLALWLRAVYENEPRVEVVDNANPYMYLRHGKNLFGFAHGDGAKFEALPAIMASDRPEDWGSTEFRLWVTGHVHHMTRRETPGCVVESFRTLATRDFWHHWKGYRSGQSLCAITFDRDYGEITRATVDLKFVRAASSIPGASRSGDPGCKKTRCSTKPTTRIEESGRRSRSRVSS